MILLQQQLSKGPHSISGAQDQQVCITCMCSESIFAARNVHVKGKQQRQQQQHAKRFSKTSLRN